MKFKKYLIIKEEETSVTTIKKKWIKDNPTLTNKEIDEAIKKFNELKAQNLIKNIEEKDIGNWDDFYKFNDFIKYLYPKLLASKNKAVAKKDVILVHDDDNVSIEIPKNHEAAKSIIPTNCPWCISSSRGFYYFDRFAHILGMTPYVVKFKNDDSDMGMIEITIDSDSNIKSMWKQTDHETEIDKKPVIARLTKLGIPMSLFKSMTKKNENFSNEIMEPLKGRIDDNVFSRLKKYLANTGTGTFFNTFGNSVYKHIRDRKPEDQKKNELVSNVMNSVDIPEQDKKTVERYLKDFYFNKLLRGNVYDWK